MRPDARNPTCKAPTENGYVSDAVDYKVRSMPIRVAGQQGESLFSTFGAPLLADLQITHPNLVDRLFAAGIAALFVAVTVLALPIALVLFTSGKSLLSLKGSANICVWGTSVVFTAASAAFSFGTEQIISLLGHLRGIERPRDLRLTLGLWMALLTIAACSIGVLEKC